VLNCSSRVLSLVNGPRRGGELEGPEEFHLVLLDNGRTDVLADAFARQTLTCIRCSACLNVCPVYERTGGHAYDSVYPGPIGAILSPQLFGFERSGTLPWASSLCGACYEVCPVKIPIADILVRLRREAVRPSASQAVKGAGSGWTLSDEWATYLIEKSPVTNALIITADAHVINAQTR